MRKSTLAIVHATLLVSLAATARAAPGAPGPVKAGARADADSSPRRCQPDSRIPRLAAGRRRQLRLDLGTTSINYALNA